MKPRVSLITLPVDDLQRALRFYRDGLGLPTQGIVGEEFEHGAVAFFELDGGLRLALWPRASLAADSEIAIAGPSAAGICLAHNLSSKVEVDRLLAEVEAAGGRIAKAPCDTLWGGYAGYFQDLDGHLWEVAWNPQMLPEPGQ
jgi:catechol 2,3-dioxygenase-like lactoylglutathione lyase family enzyme